MYYSHPRTLPDAPRSLSWSAPPAARPSNARRSGPCARPAAGIPSSTSVRAGLSFYEFSENVELAARASLLPRRFGVDGIILFYDITTLPVAMGQPFTLQPAPRPGARPARPHAGRRGTAWRPTPTRDRYQHIRDLLRLVKEELRGELPVLVFAGAPFTVAAYCIGTGKDMDATRRFAAEQPEVWDGLLDRLDARDRRLPADADRRGGRRVPALRLLGRAC